jgi:fibronectin-binding autotransporter adhesin
MWWNTLAGPINVGALGSTIGLSNLSNSNGIISGPISGGPVTLTTGDSPYYTLQLTGQNNTYTGLTTVTYGTVELIGSGRLTSTSGVVLADQGELRLDGSGDLPASIPIAGNGGTLSLYGTVASVGSFTANLSLSTILAGNGSSASLTIQSLLRNPGATLQFAFDTPTYNGLGFSDQIFIANAPLLHNGIIGGWAVVENYTNTSNYSFATYGSSGVALLTNAISNINLAAGTDNVTVSSAATLSVTKTVNSLKVFATTLSLGGNSLAVDTGGLIVGSSTVATGIIANGTLTGGAFSNGELIVFGGGTISANIADTPVRPTILTSTGPGLILSGSNTYTGGTVVSSGDLQIAAPSALPAGGDVTLTGGRLIFQFSTDALHPIVLGNVRLEGTSANSYMGTTASSIVVQATSWAFDTSTLNIQMAGSGPTDIYGYTQTSALFPVFSLYQGNITIHDGGTLYVNGSQSASMSLGSGTTTINSGGLLSAFATPITGTVVLNGGAFQSGSYSTSFYSFTGNLSVINSSSITALIDTLPATISPGAQLTVNSYAELRGGIKEPGSPTTSSLLVTNATTLKSGGIQVGALTVLGSLQMIANGTSTGTSKINALSIAGSPGDWSGAVDLTNNKLIVEDASTHAITLNTLSNQTAYGRTHTAGILSSALPAHTTLAVLDNAVTNFTTFGGLPVDPNSILIAPELLGDANADGAVTLTDLNTILANLGTTTLNWTSGNFDNQPTIDLTDLNDVLNNLGQTFANNGTSIAPPTPTPEPTSLLLASLTALPLLTRRRK